MRRNNQNAPFHLLITSALFGCLVGLLDFVLFEIHGNFHGVREYILYKPGFFGLNLLSTVLMWFALLGVLSLIPALLTTMLLRLFRPNTTPLLTLPLSVATVGFAIVTLRIYKYSSHTWMIAFLIIGCTLIVVFLYRHQVCKPRPPAHPTAKRLSSDWMMLGVFSSMILLSFFAPDIFSLKNMLRRPAIRSLDSPNVLLIVIDTVRADHLSCYGYQKNTTPNIDNISREGLLFRNAFSPSPWTLPAHASIFTGLFPSEHHADWGQEYLPESYATLAELLADTGYYTVAFSENPFVGRSHGLDQGFKEFHETWRQPLVVRAISEVATLAFNYKDSREYSKRTSRLFQRWIINNRNLDLPFFAYINFMTGHLPRYPRDGYGSGTWNTEDLEKIEPVNLVPERFYVPKYRLDEKQIGIMREIYDGEIEYLDEQIGLLIKSLEELKILDGTVLIITSDHGENFGDHGLFEHQFCLYNSLLNVPLIIRYPKMIEAKTVDERVSTISLFDTILEFVRNSKTTRTKMHRFIPLHKITQNQTVIAEFHNGVGMLRHAIKPESSGFDFTPFDRDLKCIITGDHKYIWSSNGNNELYDISSDRNEMNDIIRFEMERAQELNQMLITSLQSDHQLSVAPDGPVVDEATEDALRALGYAK